MKVLSCLTSLVLEGDAKGEVKKAPYVKVRLLQKEVLPTPASASSSGGSSSSSAHAVSAVESVTEEAVEKCAIKKAKVAEETQALFGIWQATCRSSLRRSTWSYAAPRAVLS